MHGSTHGDERGHNLALVMRARQQSTRGQPQLTEGLKKLEEAFRSKISIAC
jgi:hypothetical protein